jgi:hypothetical protein
MNSTAFAYCLGAFERIRAGRPLKRPESLSPGWNAAYTRGALIANEAWVVTTEITELLLQRLMRDIRAMHPEVPVQELRETMQDACMESHLMFARNAVHRQAEYSID